MPLFTPARLLWSHPSYNHSPEGVCTPTLRHRGKSRLKLHSPSASHPSKKSPVYQIPFTSSDSVAMVSKVSPVHCGPLFCLTLINESSGSNALTPVNPIPPPAASIYSIPESICFPLLAVTASLSLQGSICNDCVYACFCGPCSWCQISREMKKRKNPLAIA